MTLSIGALELEASAGGDVQVEILADDFPERYGFLEEPKLQRVTGTLSGEDTYGQITWQGFPAIDATVLVEIVTEGNAEARFQWSEDNGDTFEVENTGILVPLGGSYVLGDSGFTAEFDASPAPEAGTEYTFTEAGEASKSGAGPTVNITGSGSIDGLIQIQTGVGTFRYKINEDDWSSPQSLSALPIALPGLGLTLDLPPEDELRLLLEAGARFDFTARGFFHLKLTRGETVELYERLRVGDVLWFVSDELPSARRSKLLSSASWSGSIRPEVGTYTLQES